MSSYIPQEQSYSAFDDSALYEPPTADEMRKMTPSQPTVYTQTTPKPIIKPTAVSTDTPVQREKSSISSDRESIATQRLSAAEEEIQRLRRQLEGVAAITQSTTAPVATVAYSQQILTNDGDGDRTQLVTIGVPLVALAAVYMWSSYTASSVRVSFIATLVAQAIFLKWWSARFGEYPVIGVLVSMMVWIPYLS